MRNTNVAKLWTIKNLFSKKPLRIIGHSELIFPMSFCMPINAITANEK